jgi:hypothetical protein
VGYADGNPWPGLQIGSRSGKPLLVPFRGKCSALATDDISVSVQVGGKSSAPLNAYSLAQCDGSALPEDTPLLGVHVGGKDGKPLLIGFCETCGGFQACECSVCCTLTGTVQLPATGSPTTWSDPIDVTLICGASYEVWNGEYYCINDLVEDDQVLVDQGITTYSGKSGSYYDGLIPATVNYVTDVWSSDEFTYDGTTYKLLYIATAFDWVDDDVQYYSCQSSIVLQVLSDKGWCILAIATGIPSGYDVSGLPDPDYITAVVTGAPESECPPGYSYNLGEGYCGGYGLLTTYPTQDEAFDFICPVVYDVEVIYAPSTKVFKVMLADLCGDEPLDLLDSFPDDIFGDEF